MKYKDFFKKRGFFKKSVSIRYRINLLKLKVFFIFLRNVYFYNILNRSKSILLISSLIILPLNLFGEGLHNHYFFLGENFKITKEGENFSPAISSNGKDIFLIVYYRKNLNDFDIYGTRVTIDGEVLDPEGIPISVAQGDQMFPSVTWNGENFFVVWQDFRSGKNWDIYGARITSLGELLDPEGIPLVLGKPKLDQVSPVVLDYILVWQGRKNPKTWNIYLKRIGENEEEVDFPILVSPSQKSQISPSAVFDGNLYFIVWQDKREDGVWEIYGARVTRWGRVIDKKGIKISSIESLEKWRPVVSWDKKHYFVLWMASPDNKIWSLYGKRIGQRGKPIEFVEFPIHEGESNKAFPAILFTGIENLILFEDEPEGNSKIFALSVNSEYNNLLFGEAILISMGNGLEKSIFPSLSSINDKILIVWQGGGVEGPYQIYGQMLYSYSGE